MKSMLQNIISTQMKETPLDEKTEHEFTNILAKISQDNPDFFENMSREELETLEYLLSEKVRQSALLFNYFCSRNTGNRKSFLLDY